MQVPFVIFLVALIAVIIFYKKFNAFVYFVVIVDIFLRVFTYLKLYMLKDGTFDFLGVIPSSVPNILEGIDMGVMNEIVIYIYLIVYIVFEVLIIKKFINRKF